jgi:transposase InsO family protein
MIEATAATIADAFLKHAIMPFSLPTELLTDRGVNFLLGGLSRFLKAGCIKKLNTLGYHPRTNKKNKQYNGILENTIFKLNNRQSFALGGLPPSCAVLHTHPSE